MTRVARSRGFHAPTPSSPPDREREEVSVGGCEQSLLEYLLRTPRTHLQVLKLALKLRRGRPPLPPRGVHLTSSHLQSSIGSGQWPQSNMTSCLDSTRGRAHAARGNQERTPPNLQRCREKERGREGETERGRGAERAEVSPDSKWGRQGSAKKIQ